MELGDVEGITPDSELDLVLSMSERERALLHACCFILVLLCIERTAQPKMDDLLGLTIPQ
jgi:hypothetical protein